MTTLGPDEPGKCEVSADVIRRALFVCDDRGLAVTMGAIGGAGLGPNAIDAELGEVLAGAHPGRTTPERDHRLRRRRARVPGPGRGVAGVRRGVARAVGGDDVDFLV